MFYVVITNFFNKNILIGFGIINNLKISIFIKKKATFLIAVKCVWQFAERIYKESAAQAEGQQAGGPGEAGPGPEAAGGAEEAGASDSGESGGKVYDADYEVVDDDKK